MRRVRGSDEAPGGLAASMAQRVARRSLRPLPRLVAFNGERRVLRWSCSAGFYRWYKENHIQSTIIIDLVGESKPCECNGRADVCDQETGVCQVSRRPLFPQVALYAQPGVEASLLFSFLLRRIAARTRRDRIATSAPPVTMATRTRGGASRAPAPPGSRTSPPPARPTPTPSTSATAGGATRAASARGRQESFLGSRFASYDLIRRGGTFNHPQVRL